MSLGSWEVNRRDVDVRRHHRRPWASLIQSHANCLHRDACAGHERMVARSHSGRERGYHLRPELYRARLKRGTTWAEIRRCNPLTAISAAFRKRLLIERDAARVDSRFKARFPEHIGLNRPSGDESTTLLLTVSGLGDA